MPLVRLLAILAVVASATSSVAVPSFVATGNMNVGRGGHTATLLPNGKVLVAGGWLTMEPKSTSSAELYDPSTGTFTTTGSLYTPRCNAAATALPDGRVLIIGGYSTSVPAGETGPWLSSAEIYDPASGTFTRQGGLSRGRYNHTATLLTNGKVLVIGGINGGGPEIYDPATGTSVRTPLSPFYPYSFTATGLPNGKVLIVGGRSMLYDESTGQFNLVAADLPDLRNAHSSTLLPSGKVLIAGGVLNDSGPNPVISGDAFLFDPVTSTYSPTGSMVRPRTGQMAVLLSDGNVLLMGGSTGSWATATEAIDAELYDSSTGTFSEAGEMTTHRTSSTATALANGDALISGGYLTPMSALNSAELYVPVAPEPIIDPALVPTMSDWVLALLAMALAAIAVWRRQVV